MIKILFFCTLISLSIFPQQYNYDGKIGDFENSSSFYINSAGNIYVTDLGKNEVYKLDSLGNPLKDVGGYGWDKGAFDYPSDVFANPLSVYVSDKNNHRIQRFDKDLNFVSQLFTRDNSDSDEQFGYPLGCSVSNQGDLYILDGENKRIVKFDLFGNFIQNFGGYDAGNYALNNPLKISVSPNNNIYVLDKKRIIIFDQYGNNIAAIDTKGEFTGMNILFSNLTLNSDSEVYAANLNNKTISLQKINLIGYEKNIKIVGSILFNQKLYLLTPTFIMIYKKVSS